MDSEEIHARITAMEERAETFGYPGAFATATIWPERRPASGIPKFEVRVHMMAGPDVLARSDNITAAFADAAAQLDQRDPKLLAATLGVERL